MAQCTHMICGQPLHYSKPDQIPSIAVVIQKSWAWHIKKRPNSEKNLSVSTKKEGDSLYKLSHLSNEYAYLAGVSPAAPSNENLVASNRPVPFLSIRGTLLEIGILPTAYHINTQRICIQNTFSGGINLPWTEKLCYLSWTMISELP